ncbi:MAG: hypothetical protein OJF49_003852 [Ktedonobacterales bacterium]|jgi:hypothetical protein|nr:MAG: hypothetical protein OJF49_003852 [Ktedonobacterales bacterium]
MGGRDLRRWLALALLGVAALPLYARIRDIAGDVGGNGGLFLWPGLGVTAVAVAGWWVVSRAQMASKAESGAELVNQHGWWTETALIVGVGVAFRVVFLTALPVLSHDAYRYVWDAHLVAHGVSPYAHTVNDPALVSLRDIVIWPKLDWRDAPTIYPPGAQMLFLLVNAVAPLNIAAMKLAMGLCDLLCGALSIVLLRQHGLDPRRSILYWWNPIPVLEFSFTGHVDAAATLWLLAALVVANTRRRGARPLAGALLGMAALTKLYPLLFVLAMVGRGDGDGAASERGYRGAVRAVARDWRFVLAVAGTVVLGYLPFLRLGLGSGGFLATYFAQRFVDQGLVFRLVTTLFVNRPIQMALQALTLLAICAAVLWLRLRKGLPAEMGVLALSAGWILVSPHLFPWYVGGLLPLLALYLKGPGLQAALDGHTPHTPTSSSTALAFALWLFVLAMPFTYVIFAPQGNAGLFDWFFIVPLAIAAYPLARRRWGHVHHALPRLAQFITTTIKE